jgi:hypothetical protein
LNGSPGRFAPTAKAPGREAERAAKKADIFLTNKPGLATVFQNVATVPGSAVLTGAGLAALSAEEVGADHSRETKMELSH